MMGGDGWRSLSRAVRRLTPRSGQCDDSSREQPTLCRHPQRRMVDDDVGARVSEPWGDALAALSAAGDGLLRCTEGEFAELDAHAGQYRAALVHALGSTDTLAALRRVLDWSHGSEGEVFAERVGLDSLSSLCSSAPQLAMPEAAQLAERIIARLAETAPAREAFSALAAGLEEVLETPLGPTQEGDGAESSGSDAEEPISKEMEAPWQSHPSTEESAGMQARGILVEAIAGGLCKALLRVKRRFRLFFSDIAGLLFCRTPSFLALLQMQQKRPLLRCHDAISRLLSECLTKAGMSTRLSPLALPQQPASVVLPNVPAGTERLPMQPPSALQYCGRAQPSTCANPAPAPTYLDGDLRAQPSSSNGPAGITGMLLKLLHKAVKLGDVEELPDLGSELSNSAEDPAQRESRVFRRLLVVCALHLLGTGGPFIAETLALGQPDSDTSAASPGAMLQMSLVWPPVLVVFKACGVHLTQLLDFRTWEDDVGSDACQLLVGQAAEDEGDEPGGGRPARADQVQAVSAALCQRGSAAAILSAVCHKQQEGRLEGDQLCFESNSRMETLICASDPASSAEALLDLVLALLPASHVILPVSSCFNEAALGDRRSRLVRASLGLALVLLVFHKELLSAWGPGAPVDFRPSLVRLVARRVVMQLCMPPPASLRVLPRAAYGALVCLLCCTLPALACMEETRRIVEDNRQEPMLVSLLCAFYKEQAQVEYNTVQQSLSLQHAAASRRLPVPVFTGPELQTFLDAVLDPRNWVGGQQAFPANAEAILGGLNLYRYLFLRAQALVEAQREAPADFVFCLKRSAREHAMEHWLKPVYNIARRCEAELQQQRADVQGVQEGLFLQALVVLGVVARCLELVESTAQLC